MGEEVIRVERVCKKFCPAPRWGMLYTALDIGRAFCGLEVPSGTLRRHEFWALQDVSFSLRRGETLAIIGANGSGKSTMLSLLNSVLAPDGGRVTIGGRVGALTTLGAGFHPLLSGRENIAINGLMLGMTRREVRQREEQIIAFADIGDFIDAPVKHYSSGMYLRLGFAIAAHAPADVLLIDELLSVGDLAFAIKCVRKIIEFCDHGGAVVLVTHAMHSVKFGCNHALWLEKGHTVQYGPAPDVANAYEKAMLSKGEGPGDKLQYDDRVELRSFDYPLEIPSGHSLTIDAQLEVRSPVKQPIFCLHMHAGDGETLVFSHYSSDRLPVPEQIAGPQRLRMTTGPLPLKPGRYRLSFSLSERELSNHLFWHNRYYPIEVTGNHPGYGLVDAAVKFDLKQ